LLLLSLRLLLLLLMLLWLWLLPLLLLGNRCGDAVLLDALVLEQVLQRGYLFGGRGVCLLDGGKAGIRCRVEFVGIAYNGCNGLLHEILNL
jgi:hypothetical protein